MKSLQVHSDNIHQELNSKFGTKLPFLISAKDLNGNVVFANDHFDILEGPGFQKFIGKNIFDLFPFEVANELWMNDVAAIEGNCVIKKIEQVKHKDGGLNDYLTLKMPLVNSQNTVIGTVAFSINTPQSASLSRIGNHKIDNDLSSAIRILKHELRTPLNAINGFSQLLRNEISQYKDENMNRMVQYIIDASEHMNSMINSTSLLSDTQHTSELFDLADICQQCKNWLEGMANEHAKSIILNFLTNGIKYSQGNHPINMRLSTINDHAIKFEISSVGKQLSIEEQSNIFNEDFRLSNQKNIEGQGLGLPIVKQILESLDCEMGVTSNDAGTTTFWFNIKRYTRLHS